MSEKEFKASYKKVGNKILNYPGHHSIAAISHDVSCDYRVTFDKDNTPHIGYSSSDISAGVTLSDCNKVVTLNFDIGDEDEQKNSLYKINTLIEELTKFRENLKGAISHRDKYTEEMGNPEERRKRRRISRATAKKLMKANDKSKDNSNT